MSSKTVGEVKKLVDKYLPHMRTQCPRVMNECVKGTFEHPNVSLSFDDIRDVSIEKPLILKELLEECLLAKQIFVAMWVEISNVFEDYEVKGKDTLTVFYQAMNCTANEFKSIFHFPFYLKQKLLVTACRHPSRNIFGPLSMPLAVDAFSIDGNVYPTIFDKAYVDEEFQGILDNTIGGNIFETEITSDTVILPGPVDPHGKLLKGLSMEDYGSINDNYMRACVVASLLLQKNVFSTLNSKLGKVHVKSLNGIKEKVLYREKLVNDMLRVTVYYDGTSGMMDLQQNLESKMKIVKRKIEINNLTFLSEDKSGNGKEKFICSFNLRFEGQIYPMWLEIQFSCKVVIGTKIDDHVDYELRRLKRGKSLTRTMKQRFPSYSKYNLVEDMDDHDVEIVNLLLELKVLLVVFKLYSRTIIFKHHVHVL